MSAPFVAANSALDRASRRLDQWLWFARLAKTRSLAARLCAAGAVTLNGAVVAKSNQAVRAGDTVTVLQGPWQRTVRVVALGARRGPAGEARTLFEETASLRRADFATAWEPLLADEDDGWDRNRKGQEEGATTEATLSRNAGEGSDPRRQAWER